MMTYRTNDGVVRMNAVFLNDDAETAFADGVMTSAAAARRTDVAGVSTAFADLAATTGLATQAAYAFTLPHPAFGHARTTGPVGTIATPAVTTAASKFSSPGLTDPEAAQQWHLARLGDISTIWKEYTGKGVKVGVYDSGVQYAHADLAANYDASLHITVEGKVYDGDYRPASGPHGTAVAGLIAAARNGVGTVGVAYGASLTGVNVFDPSSEDDYLPGIFINADDAAKFYAALREGSKFDVVNHSWGGLGIYHEDESRGVVGTRRYEMAQAVGFAAETGRDGLGTITVAAAGNTRIDGQADGLKTDRHIIAVAAYRELDGYASSYSAYGDHILVSAPSDDFGYVGGTGIVTTDLLGRYGYNLGARPNANVDYTDAFGGTSAATPIVSGVVALMLDSNPDLGWRDVKNILAASATMPTAFEQHKSFYAATDGFQYKLNNTRFELAGRDANWNGGAMHFSGDYGYGAVNAYNAVRLAEVWSLFGAAKTSDNELRLDTGRIEIDTVLPTVDSEFTPPESGDDFKQAPVSFTFDLADNISLEHLDLTLFFNTERGYNERFQATPTGLRFKLTAPDGTTGFVDTSGARASELFNDTASQERSYTFGFSNFRGVPSKGTWTIEFEELFTSFNNTTTIHGLSVSAFGSDVTTGDVFTYTNEFATMAAIAGESGRRTLADTDGGVDWINAAAVSADVAMSLAEGGITTFGGTRAFKIAAGTKIENAVSGDGNDTLIGNALDNELHGMRGNDTLSGGLGRDRLFGGAGDDTLNGGAGIDLMDGGEGNDLYVVDTDGDLVIEGRNGGTDTVNAGTNYTLTAQVENLYLTGTARVGTGNALDTGLFGTGGGDTLSGLDGNDLLKGWGGDDRLFGGAGRDTLYGAEGNDWLDGGTGADTLQGDGGNDTYIVDDARDVVTEYFMSGQGGVDTVYASVDWTLGANVENLFLTGSAALNGTGNALANTLRGGAGANVLRGEAGDDTLLGLAGNDILWGGAGADTFMFGAGFGKDTIRDFGKGDRIDLSTYVLDGAPAITDLGADTLIDLGGGNTILLTGIDPDQLSFTGNAFGFAG